MRLAPPHPGLLLHFMEEKVMISRLDMPFEVVQFLILNFPF